MIATMSIVSHSLFVFGLLCYALVALAIPANVPLEERQANQSGKLTDPPGSVLATPAELPTYSPIAGVPPVLGASTFPRRIYKSCPDSNRAAINTAWADFKQLSDAFASWKLNGALKMLSICIWEINLIILWLSRSHLITTAICGALQVSVDLSLLVSAHCIPLFLITLHTIDLRNKYMLILDIFVAIIQKHQGLFEGKFSTSAANLWVYYNEDSFWFSQCTKGDSPPVAVIAYEQEDTYFNNWYITFYPQFYNSSWIIPFQQMESNLKEPNPNPNVMEAYYGPSGTQAATFFQETMHMSQLVTAMWQWIQLTGF